MNFSKHITKSDAVIILALLAAALIISVAVRQSGDGNVYAEIIRGGEVIYTADLSADRTFSVSGLPNIVFCISDGKIAFTESDCPDKICVGTGYISESGDTAACLPNKTVLHIKGGNGHDTIIR